MKPTKEILPTPSDLADALESADWSGNSIGNKLLLKAAITHLRLAANLPSEEEIIDIIASNSDGNDPMTVLTKQARAIFKRLGVEGDARN